MRVTAHFSLSLNKGMQCLDKGFDVIYILVLLQTLSLQVTLLSHLICFGKPRNRLFIDVIQGNQSKGMDVIARRDRLNPSKPG
jgi:hypothetical protein